MSSGRIREVRLVLGLGQDALGERAGTDANTIRKLKLGIYSALDALAKLARRARATSLTKMLASCERGVIGDPLARDLDRRERTRRMTGSVDNVGAAVRGLGGMPTQHDAKTLGSISIFLQDRRALPKSVLVQAADLHRAGVLTRDRDFLAGAGDWSVGRHVTGLDPKIQAAVDRDGFAVVADVRRVEETPQGANLHLTPVLFGASQVDITW